MRRLAMHSNPRTSTGLKCRSQVTCSWSLNKYSIHSWCHFRILRRSNHYWLKGVAPLSPNITPMKTNQNTNDAITSKLACLKQSTKKPENRRSNSWRACSGYLRLVKIKPPTPLFNCPIKMLNNSTQMNRPCPTSSPTSCTWTTRCRLT